MGTATSELPPPGKTFLAHHLVTPGSPGCAVPGPRRPGSHLCVLCLPSAPHPRCPAPLSVSLCAVQLSWRKKWPQAPVCPPGTPTTARGARRGPAHRGGVGPKELDATEHACAPARGLRGALLTPSGRNFQIPSWQQASLQGLMLKLQVRYPGHLMRRADSLEETLMLVKIEARRRRGQQRVRWLHGITDSMDMSFSKLREMLMDRTPGVLQSMGSQRVGHD